MSRVKTLSKWLGRYATKASACLSLFTACQRERWAMDFVVGNNLLVLGFVSTLGTMDRLSPLMDKSSKKPLRNRLFLTPSEIEALPSFIHKVAKRVEQKWFDFSIEDRRELFNIAEDFLIAFSEKGVGEEQPRKSLKLPFRYFCFFLSFKWACFVTRKNLKEDILKAFYYLVDSDPPTAQDFLSLKERRPEKKFDDPVLECQACGVSVYTDCVGIELAKEVSRSLKKKKIAKGTLLEDSGKVKNTPSQRTGDTHHTWWPNKDIEVYQLFTVISQDSSLGA